MGSRYSGLGALQESSFLGGWVVLIGGVCARPPFPQDKMETVC